MKIYLILFAAITALSIGTYFAWKERERRERITYYMTECVKEGLTEVDCAGFLELTVIK